MGHLESNVVGLAPVISWTWPMVVLRRVELVSLDFGLVLHLFWALICLVVGLVSLGLMSGIYFAKFLVYFRLILCAIPTCPLANE